MRYSALMLYSKVHSVNRLSHSYTWGTRFGVQNCPDTKPRALYPVGEVFTRTLYTTRTVARSRWLVLFKKTRVLGFGRRCNGNSAIHRITPHIYALLGTDVIFKSTFCQSAFPLLHVGYTVRRVYKTVPTPNLEPCARSGKCLRALRTPLELLLGHGG